MTRTVVVSPLAKADLERLSDFLVARSNPQAARKARETLRVALESLRDLAARGRPVSPDQPDIRELPVAFGRYGYAVRYQLSGDVVFVARIYHVLEDR